MSLQRGLGTREVFAISTGAMISSGLFVLPGLAYYMGGPSMVVAYMLAGFLTIPALFSKAELATAMPKAGGIYFYVDRSMGKAMGTLGGLASWFSLSFKSAFALVGIGAFALILFPDLTEMQLRLIAAGFCVFFTIVNLISVHHAGKMQVYMVMGLLVILSIYVMAGLGSVEVSRFEGFFADGWTGLIATTGLVFVSFGGLTKAASVAEEVRDPGRDLPRGMFMAFGVVVLLYTLAMFVTVGIVDGAKLSGTLTPMNLGAEVTLGAAGVIAVTIGAILAFVSTANAGIMASSRVPMAMSRDRLMPSLFGRVDKQRGVPTAAIIFTGGFMTAVILFLDLESLVKTASTLKLMLFALVNVAVIVMRESRIQNYRPMFRGPLYPWLHIFGIVAYCVLIAAMGTLPIALAGGFVVVSLIWYAVYGRRWRMDANDSALIHVVKRVAGKDLADRTLGTELSSILRERDGITEDRFDRLVRSSKVLELHGKPSLESAFAYAAEALVTDETESATELAEMLLDRERDTSTALSPNLAVPHAIVEGEGRFHLVIARSREGVAFSDSADSVHAMFFLVGSRDERNFHLRSLMAIAEIARQPTFLNRWKSAKTVEDLRDLLLLADRRRQSD